MRLLLPILVGAAVDPAAVMSSRPMYRFTFGVAEGRIRESFDLTESSYLH
jgi:hypothetical protein